MRIACFSTKPYDVDYFERYRDEYGQEITYYEARLNAQTVGLTDGFEGVCVFVNDELTEETIQSIAQRGIRLIALRCAGFNNVDLKAAAAHGIRVVRVPVYSPHAVAEHALAIILTLNRKIHKAYNRVRENNFSLARLLGFDLNGKTVGVIGTGSIGRTFCSVMQGIGCRVVAHDPYPNEALQEKGVEYLSTTELFRQSHIISLHCPLTPQTHHIINAEALGEMKKGAMLINTSRGALIDTQAVIGALRRRQLGSLGIDVYEQEEKIFFQDRSEEILEDEQIMQLIAFPNVLITAHQAFFTHEALDKITTITLQNIKDFEEGAELENEIVLMRSK